MKKVLVETSARHIHLSREAVDVLFGEGYQLTNIKDLSQPGQFACQERVTVVGLAQLLFLKSAKMNLRQLLKDII